MGKTLIMVSAFGPTVESAYEYLVDRFTEEYGNNPYNGTISTLSLGKQIAQFSDFTGNAKDRETLKRGIEPFIGKVEYGCADYVKLIHKDTGDLEWFFFGWAFE